MDKNFEEQHTHWEDLSKVPDALQRNEFSERICRGLNQWQSRESLVVAVYGPWGSGKTWLLHKIQSTLSKSSSIQVCDFAPWEFESSEQILAEFFLSILRQLEAVDTTNENAIKRKELWKTLAQVVTVGHLGLAASATCIGIPPEAVGSLGTLGALFRVGENAIPGERSIPSVQVLRDQLTALFKEPDSPRILVTIDDMDRLEDEHIRMIFRMIKATANFPNLNYLLMGERRQLASALDPISGNDGDRYLEKIVQVPLTLPEPDSSHIRARLWSGLELIASQASYDLDKFAERFDSFWYGFLSSKLKSLRNVHRLLMMTSFHAKCLTQEDTLEVDLLDLLAIDFIRIFSPTLYDHISGDPINQIWLMRNRSYDHDKRKDKDSKRAIALMKLSDLEEQETVVMLLHLFPDLSRLLSEYISENNFWTNDHQKFKQPASSRPIRDDRFQPLYFQLSISAARLPQSRYEEFLRASGCMQMIRLLEEWASKGWRGQLIDRIKDDSYFWESTSDPREFLLALSSVSDELGGETSLSGSELRSASQVWLKFFGKIPESEKFSFIKKLASESKGISIVLFLVEDLRARSGCAYSEGVTPDPVIPQVTEKEIEALVDAFLPEISKRIWHQWYPVSDKEGYRFYRLAHAIGPKRLESILRQDLESGNSEFPWAVARAVVSALKPTLRVDLLDPKSVDAVASGNVVKSLRQFASDDFWQDFYNNWAKQKMLFKTDGVILRHISTGIKNIQDSFDEDDPPSDD